MFARIKRILRQFFRKSRTINNQPLNKVSLIVIIVIDIFILINVFTGLDDIGRWYVSPSQAYPCYSEWQNYRTQTDADKDFDIIRNSLNNNRYNRFSQTQIYQRSESKHLGKVSPVCLNYGQYKDNINNDVNQQIVKKIDQKQNNVSAFKGKNRNIRAQYDSSLLEKIAGQPREQSITEVSAAKAKLELDKNNRNISMLEQEISNLKKELINKPESINFVSFLQDSNKFNLVNKGYKRASFWYPSIQLAFQSLFLIPLIIIALLVHKFALTKGYGLISLISWHLLVIFFIPLILKIFEFLQIGAIFDFIFNIIKVLFGELLFLVSYVYILLIPLIGFGIIKFFQEIVFNPKIQATNRFQKSCCMQCGKKIRHDDTYCPHCGYYQYLECQNCHNFTYKHLSHCKHCGHPQGEGND
ncbi:MAG: hypothetical protein QNJ51_09730 [Calothrix sp. MO_167.B12]|nr:hypothetical protein [Calothrix sp. MO_167.B12]